MRARVHWHYHKKLYSMFSKTERGWRAIRDENRKQVFFGKVVLDNVSYKVSQAGRQRVLDTGQRNVHAWVEGNLVHYDTTPMPPMVPCGFEVEYNPFKYDTFMAMGVPVHETDMLSAGIFGGKPLMLAVGYRR